LEPPYRTRPIRVALRVADRALRARIAYACEDAGIVVADTDEAQADANSGADIVLADQPVKTAAPVIAVSSGEENEGWREAWSDDVRAIVPADIDAVTLTAVVFVVAAGFAVMRRDDIDAESVVHWPDPVDGADELPIALTPREREVLALLAEGASNKAIARALAVSVHTAKFHVASLTEKLGAHGRLEAIAIAIRAGLVMV
jgi:DNA-binding NarL/FixJ family response regulator